MNGIPFQRRTELRADFSMPLGMVQLYLWERRIDDGIRSTAYGAEIVMKERKLKDAGQSIAPILSLSTDSAQELMDDLWRCGVRPTEGKGSAGQLAAVQAHLADMRAIVAHKLEVVLPPKA